MQLSKCCRLFGIFVGKCSPRASFGRCGAGNDDASCRDQLRLERASFAAAVSCDTNQAYHFLDKCFSHPESLPSKETANSCLARDGGKVGLSAGYPPAAG